MRTDDVVIVGAGPVGLCLALLLSERGIAVRVLEAERAVNRDLRASTFHPPTLDLLEPFGVTEDLIGQGLICPHWQIRLHPSGERAVFDLAVLADDTRHPYRLQCEQWKLSTALLERVLRSPRVQVDFGARVKAVVADDGGVTVELTTSTGRERLRAAYVVGCDGARSIVREFVGIEFEGAAYPETTLLATTVFPFEQHLEGLSNVSYCWKDGGNFSLLKVPGRWRVSIYPDESLPLDAQMTEQALDTSLQAIVPRSEPYEIREPRPYRVHMRLASSYRRGRVLLAGDAAHLNAPAGGMGLNGGIHDAFELSAALADVIKHGAPQHRLDRYDRRRRPVARDDIIGQADRNRARMRERAPEKRRELLRELKATAADRARLHGYLLKSSMIEGLRRAAAID